ncbi:recombinase family protein [Paenibacillus sp. FSL H3-0333]|uniref:recombinase family protein n=1 Tax=Paenibacillus sp. FSL H3-0333 TaxID=2921373 RepID=UPI0030F6A2BD
MISKIKAIVYARVSTDMQVDNYSIESQIERCVNLANQKGITDDEIVVLVEDGESGDNPNRPMINYVCFLLEYGIGDHAIFLHPSRMSRFLQLQTQISNRIWGLGKDFWFVEFDFDKSNPESMLNFNIQGSISEYNKAKILADTKRGRTTKVKNNLIPGINRIYGYHYDKELDTLVVNPQEKDVYLKMVDLLLVQNFSVSRIAFDLSLKGIAAPKGKRWYQSTISRILKNETYIGTFYFGKTKVITNLDGTKKQVPQPREEWTLITVPSYINQETYERIQKKIESLNTKTRGRPSEDYLLRGLSKCGRCGGAVSSGTSSKTNGAIHKYYTCVKKAKKSFEVGSGESNQLCRGKNWRVDYVDKMVWEYILNIILHPESFLTRILNKQNEHQNTDDLIKEKKDLIKLIKEKEYERNRYTEMYASGIIKTLKEVEEKVQNIDQYINELKESLHYIDTSLTEVIHEKNDIAKLTQSISDLQKILSEHITMEDKRNIVGVFIKRVVFNEDNKIDIFMNFTQDRGYGFTKEINTHGNIIISEIDGGPPQPVCPDSGRVFRRD